MVRPFDYWTMPGIDGKGRGRVVQVAKNFFQQAFPEPTRFSHQEIDSWLWEQWQIAISQGNHANTTSIELCLRCRIAHLCCRSFWKLFRSFALGNRAVIPRELFTRLDYDDGKIVNLPNRTADERSNCYQPLTLEILRDYRPDRLGKVSLARLAEIKVRQDPQLQQFLLDLDILPYSKWRLLNRASLMHLTSVDRQITRIFRAVYQRDRRQKSRSRNDGRCLDPTTAQLEEMLRQLQSLGMPINSSHDLQQDLEKIANYLRQAEICRLKGFCSSDSVDNPTLDPDKPGQFTTEQTPDPLEIVAEFEFQAKCKSWNLRQFCQEQLLSSLDWAIAQAIEGRIAFLASKPKRSALAPLVKPALRLLYAESRSLTDIAMQLGLKGQPQLSLMLEPKKLVEIMRDRTIEDLQKAVLTRAIQLGLTKDPPEIDYFNGLAQAIATFVNAQVFQTALKELSTAKNRSMDSLLAQRINLYLCSSQEDGHG